MLRVLTLIFAVFFAVPATAQGNYLIAPGDQLSVEVLEDSSLNRRLLVLPDGRINFPLAGSVIVGGRSVTQVERALVSQLTSSFAAPPTVYVAVVGLQPQAGGIEAARLDTVYLLGEVNSPGPKTIEPGTTVLQLLSQSGGFTRFAATKRLQLRRKTKGEEQLISINYRAIARGASLSLDPVLRDGDVLLVPERRLFE